MAAQLPKSETTSFSSYMFSTFIHTQFRYLCISVVLFIMRDIDKRVAFELVATYKIELTQGAQPQRCRVMNRVSCLSSHKHLLPSMH